jgi:hypothetical protein
MNSDKNPESDGFERLAEAIEDLTEAIREGNSKHDIARAMRDTLISPNEADRNFEPANVVDALAAISRSLFEGLKEIADAIREREDAP